MKLEAFPRWESVQGLQHCNSKHYFNSLADNWTYMRQELSYALQHGWDLEWRKHNIPLLLYKLMMIPQKMLELTVRKYATNCMPMWCLQGAIRFEWCQVQYLCEVTSECWIDFIGLYLCCCVTSFWASFFLCYTQETANTRTQFSIQFVAQGYQSLLIWWLHCRSLPEILRHRNTEIVLGGFKQHVKCSIDLWPNKAWHQTSC